MSYGRSYPRRGAVDGLTDHSAACFCPIQLLLSDTYLPGKRPLISITSPLRTAEELSNGRVSRRCSRACSLAARQWDHQEAGRARHGGHGIKGSHRPARGLFIHECAFPRVTLTVLIGHQTVYHHVIPVPRIRNAHPQNLELMNRVDLHSAFSKINLWRQTQFSKIVYIDADIVAYRAPDELFDIEEPFSAAADIGWPDIFNTGVMVLKPDLAEYDRLLAKAEDGVSFDGADQGLLNMHFGTNYNRISFTYNVTPSAHYQYIPAYKHFQSSINMVHFIGAQKPWFQGRPEGGPATTSGISDVQEASPHEKMMQAWWDVYDKHYKEDETV